MGEKVAVFWDLDNKPPGGQPYEAATALVELAQRFGDVVDISAYANRHAFVDLPQWVLAGRRERRRMDFLERKGIVMPDEPNVCGVCGRKCRTNSDLKKHFKQLHQRERPKEQNRMRSLKGEKRQRYKERFISGTTNYEEAATFLLIPKVGYGLASELRRAGVFVKTVEEGKPQAAYRALMKQMHHSVGRGIDWLFLVSDDSSFANMLSTARASNLGTMVIGDWDSELGRCADLWVPWAEVENREVTDDDLMFRNRRSDFEDWDSLFSISHFIGDGIDKGSLDSLVDKLVVNGFECNGGNVSASFEGEEDQMGRVPGIRGGEPYPVPWPISWRG